MLPRSFTSAAALALCILLAPAASRGATLPSRAAGSGNTPPRARVSTDGSWLMSPEVFQRLSSGGRRLALHLNGRRPLAGTLRRPNAAPPPPAAAAGPLQPLQNVRVNDPSMDQAGHTNSESWLAVRGSQVLVGFNDASSNVAGYAVSTDGGSSFTHRRLPVPAGGGNFGDPVVAYGPAGEAYYATLITNADGNSSIGVAKSTDGGATFSTPVDAALPVADSSSFQDKDWLAVDTSPTSPRKGNVYVSWTYFAGDGSTTIAYCRSTDGGQTFSTPNAPFPPDFYGVQNSVLAVAPNGDVYMAFEDLFNQPDGITIVKSTDGGVSFPTGAVAATFYPISLLTGGGGVRASSYPTLAVDGNGVVHLAWASVSAAALTDRANVFYVRSTNAGTSFSSPVRLNDDGTSTTQAFPSLAAAADGTVAVKWTDRRNDPVTDGLTDVYMAISRDGGATFGKNFRVTDRNWLYAPVEPGDAAGYHGDYDGLVVDGANFYATWSDERSGDADIYLALVPKSWDGGSADFGAAALQPYAGLRAGESLTLDVATSATNGFAGTLALSASPAVPGLSYAFSSGTVAAGQTAHVTVSASLLAAPGDYVLAITATAGGVSRATSVWLTVYDGNRPASLPANVTRTAGFTAGAGVKADASGVLHLLVEDDTAAVLGEDVFYRRSTDGGQTWSSPLKLNAAGSYGIDTALAVGTSGRVAAVWTGQQSGDSVPLVYAVRSTDGGATFSAPVAVSTTAQFPEFPAVAIDASGKVFVAYYDVSQVSNYVFTSRSTNGGTTWDAPLAIGSETSPSTISRPGVAYDSKGAVYVTYGHIVPAGSPVANTVRLAIATDGRNFKAPVDLTSTVDALGPDVAVGPDDSVAIAFYNRVVVGTSVNRDIALVRSTDAGATFSAQAAVSNNAGQSYFPTVAVEPGGGIGVAWEDTTDNGQTDVFYSRSADGGKTFSVPFNVSANLGLSGSSANPLESTGGSGRAALSTGAGGSILVSWTDDSPANPDVFLSVLSPSALANHPPTASITSPGSGLSVEAGIPVTFAGTGIDPDGEPVTYSWSFGDGTTSTAAAPGPHPFAVPGTYQVTLIVRDPHGAYGIAVATVTVTAPSPAAGPSLLLPVVLDTPGQGGSHYSTEVTLVSRETAPVDVVLLYTASQGQGTGTARLTLAPGEMRVVPGMIGYLRSRNLAIPADGSAQVGTLLVTFGGASSAGTVFAGARTFTPDPAGGSGTFGLFYPAARTTNGTATVFGLQQSDTQRANLAVVNAGSDPITLRVALQGPNGEDLGTLPDQALGPHGWWQFNHPLQGLAGAGRAVVTRVSGTSAFTAYGALNDAVTSDGSYLPPVLEGDTSGADRLIPVVLDVQGIGGRFKTELTLTNFTSGSLALTLVYTAASGYGSGSGSVALTLGPGEQRIVPDAITLLRGSLAIEADGRDVGGSLLVKAPGGTATGALAVGARTFVPASGGGTYGLFYIGLTQGESASAPVWIYGLQQNTGQRSNLAIVNRGNAGDTVTLRITYFDATGAALGSPVTQSLAPGEWHQFGHPLLDLGASAGYAKVERIAGTSAFAAYGVLNDNFTSDGSYIPMSF